MTSRPLVEADGRLHCPSAQPEMADAQVLGVVSGTADEPRIAYLNTRLPATEEVLAASAPLPPTRVFRLAARCEEHRCTHFDGEKCQLAVRIVAKLQAVTEHLPPCAIRPTCRWHEQEGRAACTRCPQIMTYNEAPDEMLADVALPGGGTLAPKAAEG